VRGPVAKLLKHYGAKMEQPIAALLERIAWDDLRVFVVVARTLNFRKAATTLRTSTATVIRRIERLESIFEFRLFNRLLDGLALTEKGQGVYRTAQEMERASHSLRAHLDQDLNLRGIVRCSVTEGLGTAWILPQLARFSRGHPATIIHLRCAMEVADVMRMETDVAIQLDKPKRPGAKSVRLGRMHIYPFASREYIETYGVPKSLDDVRHHRIIHQQAPQVDENAVQRWLNLPSIEGIVALRTNTSTAHGRAVELGMGIGGLPTYIMALGSDLIPIDIGIKHPVEIWMTYHPDARGVSRVSFFMDWLKTLFDPKRNPWFADEFIHPNELIGREPPPEKTPGVFGLTNRRVAQG
jgi:DNA-binding transcriptional LysR family regulator